MEYTLTVLYLLCSPLFVVPIIEEHPKSGMVELGKDLTLVCKAVGKNLRFSWYKNTKCLVGEVSALLSISVVESCDKSRDKCWHSLSMALLLN